MILVGSMQNHSVVIEEPPNVSTVEKVIHGGITRLKQHIAHISGQVEGCQSVPVEMSQSIRLYMSNASNEKIQMTKKKELY